MEREDMGVHDRVWTERTCMTEDCSVEETLWKHRLRVASAVLEKFVGKCRREGEDPNFLKPAKLYGTLSFGRDSAFIGDGDSPYTCTWIVGTSPSWIGGYSRGTLKPLAEMPPRGEFEDAYIIKRALCSGRSLHLVKSRYTACRDHECFTSESLEDACKKTGIDMCKMLLELNLLG
jgi:hypothetical protein